MNAGNSTSPPPTVSSQSPRLESLDFIRGLVMILMVLDHTRGMVGANTIDPTDLARTSAGLFFTRWITHFCAPAFVFLAGIGAALSRSRGKDTCTLSRFLLTRGLMLIALEFTVVRFGWAFDFHHTLLAGQVIWALGCSMIALAWFVRFPPLASGIVGIGMIALHNLLDSVKPEVFGAWHPLWGVLHGPHVFELVPGLKFLALYPLVPWVGVMLAGYAFGTLLHDPAKRTRCLITTGLILTATFIVMRSLNNYGDPHPWSGRGRAGFTLLSFVNVTKYPPSLLFLLLTLGPMLVFAGFLESRRAWLLKPVILFGRVPLFFYLVHLPLIHLLAVAAAGAQWRLALGSFYFQGPLPEANYGHGLPVVYAVWVVAVLILYPVCLWFARVKAGNQSAWARYL